MKFGIITLFPEMFSALDTGVIGRAQNQKIIELIFKNPRDFATDKHGRIDDKAYGGGPGMVLQAEPLLQSIAFLKQSLGENTPVIYLSPQGVVFKQPQAKALTQSANLILLCGRYEGIDERVIELAVDIEISIGDYVLSGGELPAMVLIDAVTRLLPGALGDDTSAAQDSFSDNLLDHPHYTRPEIVRGKKVPEVLLSGNHAAIEAWRQQQALEKTKKKRPDLLK